MTTIYRVKWLDIDTNETYDVPFTAELDAVNAWQSARLYVNLAPVSVTTDAMREYGLELGPQEVTVSGGGFIVDGMPLDQWSDAMTMD